MNENWYGIEIVREVEGEPTEHLRVEIPEMEFMSEDERAELSERVAEAVRFIAEHSEELARHRHG
jgi:hypothetical protein